MTLLKLGVYHPTYLNEFYRIHPECSQAQYSVQHAALIDDRFGSSDFWTYALSNLGYETSEIISNAELLQKRWATEAGFKFIDNNWLFEIVAAQIKSFRPDVLLVADYTTFTAKFLQDLRAANPSIKLILGWCGAPYSDVSVFRGWDIALSCVPELVEEFRAGGLSSFHVNHAFDSRVLQKLQVGAEPKIDFAFIGSIVKQMRFHIERERLLLHLIEHTNLQIWSDIRPPAVAGGKTPSAVRRLYERTAFGVEQKVLGRLSDSLPILRRVARRQSGFQHVNIQHVNEAIVRRVHSPLFGIEMFQRLKDTRVVFNNHIDISRTNASNMRLFETTGVGTCLLTDSKENLSELFEADKEVLTYRSAEECVEKVSYILEHEVERRAIADAGQARTFRDHNYNDRAARIDEVIRGALCS